jgi:hypothetical protein
MKRPSEAITQELADARDSRTDSKTTKERQIQKILWGAAAVTVAFLSYSALRLYCLGQTLGAETVTCLGLLLMIPMFTILHLLGPIRKRELQPVEARLFSPLSPRRVRTRVARGNCRHLASGRSLAPEFESSRRYL